MPELTCVIREGVDLPWIREHSKACNFTWKKGSHNDSSNIKTPPSKDLCKKCLKPFPELYTLWFLKIICNEINIRKAKLLRLKQIKICDI